MSRLERIPAPEGVAKDRLTNKIEKLTEKVIAEREALQAVAPSQPEETMNANMHESMAHTHMILAEEKRRKETQEETIRAGLSAALEDEQAKLNNKDAFVPEAEGLLKELAARTNAQKNAEVAAQVEEDIATVAAPLQGVPPPPDSAEGMRFTPLKAPLGARIAHSFKNFFKSLFGKKEVQMVQPPKRPVNAPNKEDRW